jgi:hypothetical protein
MPWRGRGAVRMARMRTRSASTIHERMRSARSVLSSALSERERDAGETTGVGTPRSGLFEGSNQASGVERGTPCWKHWVTG